MPIKPKHFSPTNHPAAGLLDCDCAETTFKRLTPIDMPDIHKEVDYRLGLFEEGENPDETPFEEKLANAVEMIREVWDFCFQDNNGKFMEIREPNQLQIVLRRFLVLTLMFRAPRLEGHTYRSLCQLLPRIVEHPFPSVSRVPLSKIGLQAVERFKLQTRMQKPERSNEVYKAAAVVGHKKRRARAEARKAKVNQPKTKPTPKKRRK